MNLLENTTGPLFLILLGCLFLILSYVVIVVNCAKTSRRYRKMRQREEARSRREDIRL